MYFALTADLTMIVLMVLDLNALIVLMLTVAKAKFVNKNILTYIPTMYLP